MGGVDYRLSTLRADTANTGGKIPLIKAAQSECATGAQKPVTQVKV